MTTQATIFTADDSSAGSNSPGWWGMATIADCTNRTHPAAGRNLEAARGVRPAG